MEVNIEGGAPLKYFMRALSCLSRFGDELDVIVTRQRCSFSTVNTSRTAFGVVHFFPTFFNAYELLGDTGRGEDDQFKFSVNAKSLLSPLRPKSANTIQSCTIQVGQSEDPTLAATRLAPGVDAGECRIIVRMNCQQGVVKTHRLTYSNPNLGNWARFNKAQCSSTWRASSRVLKEWTDHFYLRTGANAATDEITFYCSSDACRLKSFVDTVAEQNASEFEMMTSRPLTTELSVATEDFDLWDVSNATIVTFALKEFKAIINLSDALSLPIAAHFTEGGRPLMMEVEGDHLEAKFVIATSNYDAAGETGAAARGPSGSASASGSVKREEPSERAQHKSAGGAMRGGLDASHTTASASRSNSGSNATRGGGRGPQGRSDQSARLFNPPTPSPAPPWPLRGRNDDRQHQQAGSTGDTRSQARAEEEDEEEFDLGGFDDNDAAFAEIDHLSQVATSQQQLRTASQTSVPPAARTTGGGAARAAVGRVDAAGSSGLGYSESGVKILARDTSEIVPSVARESRDEGVRTSGRSGTKGGFEEDEDFGKTPQPEPLATDETVLGPTQGNLDAAIGDGEEERPRKKSKWNILDDE